MIEVKNRILTMALILSVLLSLAACKGDAVQPTDAAQLQATGNSEAKPSEEASGAAGSKDPMSETTAEESTGKTVGSEATEVSSSAPTEAGIQPTQPTQSTTQPTQSTTPPVTEPPHQHSYTATVVAPTCNEKGYTLHSCSCGHSYKDNYTEKLGHHFVDEVVAPTSTDKGYTKHTCDRCWYSYNDTYTDPVKQVYDINAAMEAGNAYALSLGFACVDYSLTPENAGYYPPSYITSDSLARIGGQSWLEQDVMAGAQSCMYNLIGIRGENAHAGCACRAYIIYDATEDAYTVYFLYA